MAATAQVSQSDLTALAARYGNEIITKQVNQDIAMVGSGALEKVKMKSKAAVINIIAGGFDSTQFLIDLATMQTGSAQVPIQGTQIGSIILSRINIGRAATLLVSGVEDSVDMVKSQLQWAGMDAARKLGRAFFNAEVNSDGYLGPSIGPVAGVYTDVGFDDVSGLREGDAVVLFDTSASQTFALEVTKITPNAVNSMSKNVAGLVTLANTVQGVAAITNHTNSDLPVLASADTFWLRGKYNVTGNTGTAVDQAAVPVSFSDISGSSTLHGLNPAVAAAGYGWIGLSESSVGVLSSENLGQLANRVRLYSGRMHSHVVMGPQASLAFASAVVSAGTAFGFATSTTGAGRRKVIGADADPYAGGVFDDYESGLRFMSKPVIIEPNIPSAQVLLHNRDVVKLGVWREFEAETEGDGAMLVDRSTFSYDIQLPAIENLLCYNRRGMILGSGITNL